MRHDSAIGNYTEKNVYKMFLCIFSLDFVITYAFRSPYKLTLKYEGLYKINVMVLEEVGQVFCDESIYTFLLESLAMASFKFVLLSHEAFWHTILR